MWEHGSEPFAESQIKHKNLPGPKNRTSFSFDSKMHITLVWEFFREQRKRNSGLLFSCGSGLMALWTSTCINLPEISVFSNINSGLLMENGLEN